MMKIAGAWHVFAKLLPLGLLAVTAARSQDVLTYHNDNARTGQNLNETILTPANVNSASFGKLFVISVDGKVDAQPLYASAVAVPGKGSHNLLLAATEHGSVYAFDADTGAPLWSISTLKPGETPSDAHSCDQVTPEIGVTGTPVIDRTRGTSGVVFLVAMSKDSSGNYFQRLHALDLATGADLAGSPVDVTAKYPGSGDNSSGGFVQFDPGQYKERPGLLLLNGILYTAWGSHCDIRPYTGWVMGYDPSTLAQKTVLNLVPNGSEGGVWMSGAGPAADGAGNIFLLAGNGDFDTTLNAGGFPANGNYGNAFLKLSTSGGLAGADYFEMSNQQQENASDTDLGSGGALVLPDMVDGSGGTRRLAVGAGKDGNLYLVDRDSMGRFHTGSNNVYQELDGVLPGGIWSMPAYFDGRIYYGPVGRPIFAFQFSKAALSTSAVAQTTTNFTYPGATPGISANGNTHGIVWATENTNPAVLHAYDAGTLQELYNSSQSGVRDHFGTGNKFITPTVAHGKVYVGTTNGVGVFGLLANASVVSLSPSAGSGASGTFTMLYSDTNGAANLASVRVLFNSRLSAANACAVVYMSAGNGLYLRNDAGTAWLGPIQPGSGSLVNAQCTLKGAGSSVTPSGNNLQLVVSLSFTGSFGGSKNVWLFANASKGSNTGWVQKGTWTTGVIGPPSAVSVSPASGSGATQSFTMLYSDPNGAADLATASVIINSALSSAHACYVQYNASAKALYLENDAGTAWLGPITPGSGSVTNSQCTLAGAGSSARLSGNNLKLLVSLSFAGSFTGLKNIWMLAAEYGGLNTGWVLKGSWTP